MADCDWWKDLPCHFSTEWNLHITTETDLRKLKQNVKVDLHVSPDLMRVESLLYLAFLEVPPKDKLLFRRERPNLTCALELIEEAEEYVTKTMEDIEAGNGYGIVINTLRMWIFSERMDTAKQEEVKQKLEKLNVACHNNEKANAFIKATQAFALSRLGLQGYQRAETLFDEALKVYPNTHWKFGKALIQGRLARHAKSRIGSSLDLPQDLKVKFQAEKMTLEEIRQEDPKFVLPIAYLGWCLFNLKEKKEALACLKKATKCDEKNTDIALISVRIYRQTNELDKCHEILENIPDKYKTAEVEFQIALLYNERAKRVFNSKDSQWPSLEDKNKEYTQLLQHALDALDKTLAKDSCHFPAEIKYAEITARCGRKKSAMDNYRDLFRRDVHPINQVHARVSFNKVKRSFNPYDVLDNIRKMLQLCTRKFTHFNENGEVAFKDVVKTDVERFLKDLNYAIEQRNEESLLARLILSEIKLGLKRYREAKEIIQTLIQKECPEPKEEIQSKWVELHIVELKWNLGKCHVGLGNISKAEKVARGLEKLPPKRQFPAHEMHSDVRLARVEKGLNNTSVSAGQQNFNCIVLNLHDAITRGSMKACFLYLTKVDDLQERLCCFSDSSSPTILQTIVEIEACIERNDTCHNSFDECPDNIEDFIKAKVKSILIHPAAEEPALPQDVQQRFKELSTLRSQLHKFEGCYRQTRNSTEGWNEVCQGEAKMLLSHARNILDYMISDYQEKVRHHFGGKKPKSFFPISVDWTRRAVNQDVTRQNVEKMLTEELFPGYNMPEEMITYFTEIQPQYNEDNLWLAVLNKFNNDSKHKGRHDNKEVYLVGKNLSIEYRKVDLVRKSCSEVEKIVKKISTFLKDNFQ